jgi:hypothetical protein
MCLQQIDLATAADAELSEWCAVALSLLYCHQDAAGLIDGQKVTYLLQLHTLSSLAFALCRWALKIASIAWF